MRHLSPTLSPIAWRRGSKKHQTFAELSNGLVLDEMLSVESVAFFLRVWR